ncbi:MAG: hypothetical protein GMKNLPBB_02184 [Myxococcota bacterium]|nr:hypothetical protein [Myxococcota bacterium]
MNRYSPRLWLIPALLIIPAAAAAQSLNDMPVPSRSVSYTGDAFSMLINPAGIGVNEGFELRLAHFEPTSGGPRAEGLFMQFTPFGLGFQYHFNDPMRGGGMNARHAGAARFRDVDYLKWTIPFAFEAVDNVLYLGAALDVTAPLDSRVNNSVDWHAGLLLRMGGLFSIGVAGKNLSNAAPMGVKANRELQTGLSFRPFTDRVTLSADYRFVQDAADPAPMFRAEIVPVRGLNLLGSLNTDLDYGVGVALDLANAGLGAFFNVSDANGYEGVTVDARFSSVRYPSVVQPGGGVMVVDVNDRVAAQPGGGFLNLDIFFGKRVLLADLIAAIDRSASDDTISGMLLRIQDNDLSLTDLSELRTAIERFKAGGKKVVAYFETAGNEDYYLASAADRIAINPGGGVRLTGLSSTSLFFKDLLDKIGVKIQYVRVGEYKSAVETFTRDSPSRENLEAITGLLDTRGRLFVTSIASGRGKSVDEVNRWMNERGVWSARKAREDGLADELKHRDQIEDYVKETIGRAIHLDEAYMDRKYKNNAWKSDPVIAVVDVHGTMVPGDSGFSLFFGPTVGANNIVKALEKARKDPFVEAVILRIDSPGGSALAGEKILREVELTKEDKPVVVSMGAVAASGGYYIASKANTIVANPGTITGSIGVYAMKFEVSGLARKIGVATSTVTTAPRADADGVWRPWTDGEAASVQDAINDIYKDFTGHVAQGRNKTTEQIDAIARGRVWSGEKAKELGLVDELGGLDRAIEIAREKAGIAKDRRIRLMRLGRGRDFLSSIGGTVDALANWKREVRDILTTGAIDKELAADPGIWMLAPELVK